MPDNKNAAPPGPDFWPGALARYRGLFATHILLTACILLASVLMRVLLVWRYVRVGNIIIMLPVALMFFQVMSHIKFMEFHAKCRFNSKAIAACTVLNLFNVLFLIGFGYPYLTLFQHGVLTLTLGIILFMAQCFIAVFFIFEIRKNMGDDPWKNSKNT